MILWRGWIPLRLGVGFFNKLLSMLDYGKQLMLPSRQTAPQSHRYSCLCLFECVLFTLKTGLGVLQLCFLLDSPKNMQPFHQNFHSLSFPTLFLQVKTLSMVLSSDFFLTWTNAHFSNMKSGWLCRPVLCKHSPPQAPSASLAGHFCSSRFFFWYFPTNVGSFFLSNLNLLMHMSMNNLPYGRYWNTDIS